jgi:hypothetical protein
LIFIRNIASPVRAGAVCHVFQSLLLHSRPQHPQHIPSCAVSKPPLVLLVRALCIERSVLMLLCVVDRLVVGAKTKFHELSKPELDLLQLGQFRIDSPRTLEAFQRFLLLFG